MKATSSILPALLTCAALLPGQALAEGVGRTDKSAQQQISVDLKSCAKPVWPKESLWRQETGKVTLEYLIGLDGKVLESKVLKSSGFPLLDMAAQDGLAKCQFSLPSSVGRTEPTRTRMQYVWTLEGKPKTLADRRVEWQRMLAEAEKGDPHMQVIVGMAYLNAPPPVERNAAEGMRWLRTAAEQGNPQAMESLAYQLKHGRNTERDEEAALAWLEKAAAQGAHSAETALAVTLLNSANAQHDAVRARSLLEKAHAGGFKPARAHLGILLLKEGSREEGLKLLQQAVDEHDRLAQLMMAKMYEKGEHVAADLAKAQALYERAAAAGNPYAQLALDRLKQQAR